MRTKKFRIAVATNGKEGLEDAVSQVFGRASTFTLVDIESGEIQKVKVIENPAVTYEHGAGPIVVKTMVDSEVNMVIAPEFGPGASALLKHHRIAMNLTKSCMRVNNAIEEALKKLKSTREKGSH